MSSKVAVKKESPKYQIEVRDHATQSDTHMLSTNDFREALAEYERLTARLNQDLNSCSYDIVCFYVTEASSGSYTPVVFATVETQVTEW